MDWVRVGVHGEGRARVPQLAEPKPLEPGPDERERPARR